MDVRAKQRLSYQRVFLPQTCQVAVSPHVISTVRCFLVKNGGAFLIFIKAALASRFRFLPLPDALLRK
jgi:hypothetical protein